MGWVFDVFVSDASTTRNRSGSTGPTSASHPEPRRSEQALSIYVSRDTLVDLLAMQNYGVNGSSIHHRRYNRWHSSDSVVKDDPRPAMPSASPSSRSAVYFIVGAGALVVLLATLSLWQLAAGIDGRFSRLWLASALPVRSQPAALDPPWINVLQGTKQYDDQGNELWNMEGASFPSFRALSLLPDSSCSCSPPHQDRLLPDEHYLIAGNSAGTVPSNTLPFDYVCVLICAPDWIDWLVIGLTNQVRRPVPSSCSPCAFC